MNIGIKHRRQRRLNVAASCFISCDRHNARYASYLIVAAWRRRTRNIKNRGAVLCLEHTYRRTRGIVVRDNAGAALFTLAAEQRRRYGGAYRLFARMSAAYAVPSRNGIT